MSTIPTSELASSVITPVLGLDGLFLVSIWKPFLVLPPILAWAWVVTSIYDKHAARFHLARQRWNMVHLFAGLIAFAMMFAIPMKSEAAIWIGLGAGILILLADLGLYAYMANKDERVPEEHRIRLDLSSFKQAREAKATAKLQGRVELVIKSPDKSVVAAPAAETPEFALRTAAEAVYIRAIDSRASQMDLGPTGKDNAYAASMLIDGVRQVGAAIPAAEAIRILDFWKSCAKLDLQDRRRRLQAEITVERGASGKKVRVETVGAQGGPRLTLMIEPDKAVRRKVAELGLLDAQQAELKSIVDERQGLVLVASPPDAGRTTTLYSIIKMHDSYTSNVQTVEMDVQDSLEGVRQNKFDAQGEGPEYSTLVRSIIRRDPDVIAVAEIPDAGTAKELARIESERCRAYAAVRADGAIQAIQAWVKAVGDPAVASKVLHGVVAGKLVRKLCQNCRVPYQPSPDMLKKLGLPADKVKQLFKKGGQVLIKNKPEVCPVCQGAGYFGQDGVFEVYPVDQAARDRVAAGDYNGLKAELRKKQLPSLQQTALRKAVEGTTSVEEIMRISGGEGAGATAAPKPTQPSGSGAT